MKFKSIAALAFMGLIATAVWAGPGQHHKMKIEISEDDGENGVHVELDSEDMGFDMHQMQVGENRSVVDKQGQNVLITRTEKGFTLNVDGKELDIPMMSGPDGHVAPTVDVDVRHLHNIPAPPAPLPVEGVMIVSESEIDETTQQVIRTALETAGHTEVRFSSGPHEGLHQVHVIREVVELEQ